MANEKPLPMQIGDKLLYTLSSYDPVQIEVRVPLTTEADVDFALVPMLKRAGGDPETVTDEWIAEHFEGAEGIEDMRAQIRTELERVNTSFAENSKGQLAAAELAKRLEQQVPAQVVSAYRSALVAQFEADMAADGMSPEEVIAQAGEDAFANLFDDQAIRMAQELAALDAYINMKKLTVNDDEIPGLLQLPPDQADQLIKQAEEDGATEQLRQTALRNKAMRSLVAEASVTYKHETAEEAAKRAEEYEQLMKAQKLAEDLAKDADKTDDKDEDSE